MFRRGSLVRVYVYAETDRALVNTLVRRVVNNWDGETPGDLFWELDGELQDYQSKAKPEPDIQLIREERPC